MKKETQFIRLLIDFCCGVCKWSSLVDKVHSCGFVQVVKCVCVFRPPWAAEGDTRVLLNEAVNIRAFNI